MNWFAFGKNKSGILLYEIKYSWFSIKYEKKDDCFVIESKYLNFYNKKKRIRKSFHLPTYKT